ncbi:MAG: DUF3006 domain-containing protein [Firmicutes bacterium]|nr:DUF3006 domain-containing protein [Bacillota bacterium]
MEIKVTVDRVEEGTLVLLVRPEEDIQILWPSSAMPIKVKEGDILVLEVEKDVEETRQAKERVTALLEKLQNKHR